VLVFAFRRGSPAYARRRMMSASSTLGLSLKVFSDGLFLSTIDPIFQKREI